MLLKIKENSSLEIANAIMSKLTPLPNFIQIAKDNYYNIVLEKNLTILNKPKLKLPSKVRYEENKQLDAYEYFTTEDTLITAADDWISTNTSVVDIDKSTGIMTLKGVGKTKIISKFGNIKVTSNIKVREVK